MKHLRLFGVAVAALFYCLPAIAQNSGAVPQYAIPIGQGLGHTGFGAAVPGTSGYVLLSTGPTSAPAFGPVAGASFGVQNANKVYAGPTTGADTIPSFRALVGADLPLPAASTLGGIKSLSASTNNFLTGLGTDGALTRAQPAFSNLSGSATCAQLPALTGNVTSSAGACATTIGSGVVSNSMLAGSIAASKLVGIDIATVGTVTTGNWNASPVPLAYGGTAASTAANARTNLGLVIGANVQAWDADLDAFALKTAPTGAVVGTTDTQTLTNKTINCASNTCTLTGVAREILSANRTYYVRTDGSDSNTGLVNSSGGAFLTLQKAINTATALDMSIYTTTIQLGDGTYTSGGAFTTTPNGPIIINGNATTPANVVIQAASPISVTTAIKLTLQNLELQGSSIALTISAPGSNVTLGVGVRITGAGYGIFVDSLSFLTAGNGLFVSGSKPAWLRAQGNSNVSFPGGTVTFSGAPAWSSAGIMFYNGAQVFLNAVTMSGSATGKRYEGLMLAGLETFGAGSASTYFPGSTNGTVGSSAFQE